MGNAWVEAAAPDRAAALDACAAAQRTHLRTTVKISDARTTVKSSAWNLCVKSVRGGPMTLQLQSSAQGVESGAG